MSEALWARVRDLERRNRAIESADLTADELLSAAMLLSLPGLRGAWPMSSFDENGDAFDLSGQGRVLDNMNSADYDYDALAPYIQFVAASSQYLTRVSEAGLNITGTEAYVTAVAQGLTLGGWFYVTNIVANRWLIGKNNGAAAGSPYLLYVLNVAGNAQLRIGNGVANFDVISTNTITVNTWHFIAGRYTTSNQDLDIWVDDTQTANAAGGPGAVAVAADLFTIATNGLASVFTDMRASMCFLCAAALSDAIIMSLFHQTRAIFRV